MNARRDGISPVELASEVGGLSTGLGVLSVAVFPLAVPGLALGLVLVLPLVVLALPLLLAWLVVRGAARLLRREPPPVRDASRATAVSFLQPDGCR